MEIGRAVIFDLGDTLVEYEGIPLSWSEHYQDALKSLAEYLEAAPNKSQYKSASEVLSRFNTRKNPRENEFSFSEILDEVCRSLGLSGQDARCVLGAARAFFKVFRQRLSCFPEVHGCLTRLKKSGASIGVFTDVPYGMPRELVMEDIQYSGLSELVDVVLTSGDCGWRKPSKVTLESICEELGYMCRDAIYVGNERKDIEVALKSGCGSVLIDRAGSGADYGQDLTLPDLSELA